MNTRSFSILLIVMALLIPAFGAMVTYRLLDDPVEAVDSTPDTGPLAQQFSTLTHAKLSGLEESTLLEIEEELSSDLGLWISSSRITLKDHRVTVLSSQVEANQVDLQVKIPVPPVNLEGDLGILITNSMMYGDMGTLPLLPGIRIYVSVEVLIEPLDGSRSFEETIKFSSEVVDPERGLLKLIQLLEADMNGWGSGMARDMEYMLNTLARYRSTKGFGAENWQSSQNILNEGDVELAFNIALALRMTRWTGQVPQNLVDAIDRFFRDRSVTSEMNPTGYRFWGETEKDMFNSFYIRNVGTGSKRSIGQIIENAVDVGHADSADIMGRYLLMDEGDIKMNVLDMESHLEEKELLDPRESSNLVDATAIEHHPSFPDSDGLLVLPRDDYLPDEENEPPTLIPKLGPVRDYMVVGRDIELDRFENTREWFTNADYTKRLTDIEVWAPGQKPEARCGNIPPPPKPADHDFRLEWEFSVLGDLDVEASYEGYGGNAPLERANIVRNVKFDFPIRVHTWFNERPVNDKAYDFRNINTGKLYWTDIVSGWYITPVANATEYFEDQVYSQLKEGLSMLSQLLRSMDWYLTVPVLDNAGVRKLAHTHAMSTLQQMDNWANDGRYGVAAKYWWNEYMVSKGLQPEDLRTIRVEGHNLTFTYSDMKDVLYIRSDLVDEEKGTGSIRLAIHGMKTGLFKVEGKIITDELSIVLSPHDDEYSISSNIEGYYFNDGPAYMNPPDQDVSSLLVEGGWIVNSPSREIALWDIPGPYVLTEDMPDEKNITLSFVLAGKPTSEPMDLMEVLQKDIHIPERIGEAQISLVLNQIASIAIENYVWFGIRTTSTGGDGAHEMSRTFLIDIDETILSSHSETWSSLSTSGRIDCLIRDLIWGASVDTSLEVNNPVNTILIEEIPSWTASTALVGDPNMMYVTHTTSKVGPTGYENLQTINVASVGNYDGDRYHYTSTGWELSNYEDISILW